METGEDLTSFLPGLGPELPLNEHKIGSALLAGTWPEKPQIKELALDSVAASPVAVREAPGPHPEAAFHTGNSHSLPPTFYIYIVNFRRSQPVFPHLLCLKALVALEHVIE